MTNQDLIPRKEVEKIVEKLFEKIKESDESNDGFLPHYRTYPTASLTELLSEISQIESVNGWIAFDDETPKDWTDIVCTDFTSYATAEVDDWDLIFEYECDIEFTHYMPLPPPPTPNKV